MSAVSWIPHGSLGVHEGLGSCYQEFNRRCSPNWSRVPCYYKEWRHDCVRIFHSAPQPIQLKDRKRNQEQKLRIPGNQRHYLKHPRNVWTLPIPSGHVLLSSSFHFTFNFINFWSMIPPTPSVGPLGGRAVHLDRCPWGWFSLMFSEHWEDLTSLLRTKEDNAIFVRKWD